MRAIVLAGGKGTRLITEEDSRPKVLREVNGKSIIERVLENIAFIPKEDIYIVVGYKKELVMEQLGDEYNYVFQLEQLGTGHAVKSAEDMFKGYNGDVLIVSGDMPLYKRETYLALCQDHEKKGNKCTVLTSVDENPPPYGRIIKDENGKLVDIIETKDCTPEQLNIKELNIGMYVFDSSVLFESLSELRSDNAQNEYYLTDGPVLISRKGYLVDTYSIYDTDEHIGINTLDDLKNCERILLNREEKNI